MRIKTTKRKNRNEYLFILEFDNQNEIDTVMNGIDYIMKDVPEDSYEWQSLNEIKEKIEIRCDDKYVKNDIYKSAVLFTDEIALLTENILWIEGLKAISNNENSD